MDPGCAGYMLKVFLSHAGFDRAPADALARGLMKAGLEVWCDLQPGAILPGELWIDVLERELRTSSGFLLLVSAQSVRRWVAAELQLALDRAMGEPRFRIVPLLLPGTEPDVLSGFLKLFQALPLAAIGAAPLTSWTDEEFGRLAEQIVDHRQRQPVQGKPFPGLGYFTEDEAAFFLGRSDNTREAIRRLQSGPAGQRRWLQIEGPSGSGKSSFAHAGLMPAVRRGWLNRDFARETEWLVAAMRPGHTPTRNLAQLLLRDLQWEAGKSVSEVDQHLATHCRALADIVRLNLSRGQRLALVVDQFEEAFTLAGKGDGAAATSRFVELLLAAIVDVDAPFTLITTIRSDFSGAFGDIPGLAAALNNRACRYYLGPLPPESLRTIIEEPVRRANAVLEPQLCERILHDVQSRSRALPLVAHMLQQLWERREHDRLTMAAYDKLGGIQGSVTASADTLLDRLPDDEARAIARRMLVSLVKVNPGGQITRRPLTRRELIVRSAPQLAQGDVLGARRKAEVVLARLSGGEEGSIRVLVVAGQADEAPDEYEVDLIHEALFQHWRTLAAWLTEHRQVFDRREELYQSARLWIRKGRHDPDALPSGDTLSYLKGAGLTRVLPSS
jgi:hypothetical protein